MVDSQNRIVNAAMTPRPEESVDRPPTEANPSESELPFIPSQAWTTAGKAGIWLPSGYWGLLTPAEIEQLIRSESDGVACVSIRRVLLPFTAAYFRLTSASPRGSSRFCVDANGLRAVGRWSEFLDTVRSSAQDHTKPMVLPAPELATDASIGPTLTSHERAAKRGAVRDSAKRGRFPVAVRRRVDAKRLLGAYCRECTWGYAQYWWNRRNSYYNNYSGSGGSAGDCANYVSQLLYTGGFRNFPYSEWYYFNSTRTAGTAWIRVTPLMNHFYNSGHTRGVGSSVAVRGDLVFYDYLADGGADHVSMVTGGNASGSGYPVVTQHDTDYLTERVQDQIARKPGMRIIYLQVTSTNG